MKKRYPFVLTGEGAAPKHLYGEMVRAHAKAVYASSRLHHGRGWRPVQLGRRTLYMNKWRRVWDRWQRRFDIACERLRPYDAQRMAETNTTIMLWTVP